ncbi:hypothetical protein ScPMuIL_015110 [Solemya velum]
MEPTRPQDVFGTHKNTESSYLHGGSLLPPTSLHTVQPTTTTAIPRKQYTLAAARQAMAESEITAARLMAVQSETLTNPLALTSVWDKSQQMEAMSGPVLEAQPSAVQINIQVNKLKYSDATFSQKLLSEMRLMQSRQQMCDLELCTENTQIKVHKLVLAAASPVLLAKFPEIMDTGDIGVEFSNKFTASMLQQFVQYLYDGNLVLSEKNVTDFLKISQLLKLHSLENFCLDFMDKARVHVVKDKDEDTGFFRIFKRPNCIDPSGDHGEHSIVEEPCQENIQEDQSTCDLNTDDGETSAMEKKNERKSPRLPKSPVSPKKMHMYGTRSVTDRGKGNEPSTVRRSLRKRGSNSKDTQELSEETEEIPAKNDELDMSTKKDAVHEVEDEKPVSDDVTDDSKVKSVEGMREEINDLIAANFTGEEKSLDNMVDNLIDIYDKNVKRAVDVVRGTVQFSNSVDNVNVEDQLDSVTGIQACNRRKGRLSDGTEIKTEDKLSLTTGSGMQRAVFDKPQGGRPQRTLKKVPAALKQTGRRGRPRKFLATENVKPTVTETMRQPPKKRVREMKEFSEIDNTIEFKPLTEIDVEIKKGTEVEEEDTMVCTPMSPEQEGEYVLEEIPAPPTPDTQKRKTPKSSIKKKRKVTPKSDSIQHIVQELEKMAAEIQDGETQFKCKLCGNEFVFPKRSVTHLIKTHDVAECNVIENVTIRKRESSPKVCDICGYATKDPNFYYIHYHKYFRHGIPLPKGWKPFTCDLCGKECFTKFQLRDHKLIHQEDTPFICEVCGQGFKSRTCLNSHVFHRHSSERKHICPECQRSFKTKTQMLVHMRTHTGEKPFHCPECPYKSTTRGNMRLHLANRHKFNVDTIRNLMYQIKTLSKAFALKTEDTVLPSGVIDPAVQNQMVPISMEANIATSVAQSDVRVPIQVTIQDANGLGESPYPVAITAILESQQADGREIFQGQSQEEQRIFLSPNLHQQQQQGLMHDQLQQGVHIAHALVQEVTQEQLARMQGHQLEQTTDVRQLEVIARAQEQRQLLQEAIARVQERQYVQTQEVVGSVQNIQDQHLVNSQETVGPDGERKQYSQLTEPITILQDPRQLTQDLRHLTQTSLSRQIVHTQDSRHLLQGTHQLLSTDRSLLQEPQPTEQVLVQEVQTGSDPDQERVSPTSPNPLIAVQSQTSVPASLSITPTSSMTFQHATITSTSPTITQVYVTGSQNNISIPTSNLSATPGPAHTHSSTPILATTPTPAHHQYDPTNLSTHHLTDPTLLYQTYYQNSYPHGY